MKPVNQNIADLKFILELGLVDEAKEITETWMGKWVTV
jgi:hypothetical protein